MPLISRMGLGTLFSPQAMLPIVGCQPLGTPILDSLLGTPGLDIASPAPQATNVTVSNDRFSSSCILVLDGTDTGYIYEGGATGRGLGLYCQNGKVIYECGDGGANETGPTGLEKTKRGYIEWQSPVGIECSYRIEISSRTLNDDFARMWVNGVLVAEDDAWSNTNSSGLSGSNGGSILQFNSNWRATQLNTSGGSDPVAIFPASRISDLKMWEDAVT